MPIITPPWLNPVPGPEDTWHEAADRLMTQGQAYGPTYVGDDWEHGIHYTMLLLTFGGEAPPPPVGDPRDRLRSHVSEDLGSIMDAVEVIPVDAGISLAHTNAVSVEPAELTAFREATRDTQSAVVDMVYYPRPRQNTVMEEQFDGITVLGRLQTWYPPRWFGTVADLGIPNTDDASTPQQVITALLTFWSTLQPWLSFKPVPDLRLNTGSTPDEYGPDEGIATTETVTISQDPSRRSNALEILRNLLSPFPGTVVRQDSDGDLIIVPAYGPDADEEPINVIRDFDAYSVSTGKPDPFSTYNVATINARGGLTRDDKVPIMQPAWFQIGHNSQFGRPTWFEPPGDRLNLQPPQRASSDTLQEELPALAAMNRQLPNPWPASPDRIPAGEGIRLWDENWGDPVITAAWARYVGNTLDGSGPANVQLINPTIDFTGVWRDYIRVWATATSGEVMYVIMRARWRDDIAPNGGVEWALGDRYLTSSCFLGTCRGWVFEITLNDLSVGYSEAPDINVTYGLTDNGDFIPDVDGNNAILVSQTAFGTREKQISMTGYALDVATLTEAARGHLLHSITPRVVRELELSAGAAGITFDTMGRLVELPSGERGVLTGRTYQDEFSGAGAWSVTARVELKDMTAPGAVPPNPLAGALTTTDGVVFTTTAGVPMTLTEEE